MAAVSAMLASSGAAIKTWAGAAGAIETGTALSGAAMLDGARVGRTVAARIGAAVFVATTIVAAGIVASIPARAAITPAATEGTLETGTWIATAYARGITREILTRSARGTRCARFAGKKNGLFLHEGRNFGNRKFATGGSGIGFERGGDVLRFGVRFFVCSVGLCFGKLRSGAGLHGF